MRGEELQVQVLDLEEDVRAGRVPAIAEVSYPPWTGQEWRRVGEVPELAAALDAPPARLSAQLRTGPFPWLSSLVTLLILGCGVLQGLAILFSGSSTGAVGLAVREFFVGALTGTDSLVFEGRWWTSFTSQLTHGGARHLFGNLAVIGYAGFRVERALGAGGFGVVAVASIVVGTVAIAVLEAVPVMGSSVLGYGLFAALVTTGLRFDDQLPPADRRFYGFGALALFVLLVVGSVGQEGVSHTGHAFGFLGGAAATFLVRPETVVARGRRRRQLRRNASLSAGLALVPALASALLVHLPSVLLGRATPVQVDGWTLAVPSELAERTASIGGARGWTTSVNSREGVFATVRDLGEREPEAPEIAWGRRSDGPLAVLAPPEPLGPGWTAWRAHLTRADGRPLAEVVEHRRQEGHLQWRLGLLVQVGPEAERGRRGPTFDAILDSAEAQEPDAVREAREAFEAGGGPRAKLAWAEQLHALGRHADADALLATLSAGSRVAGEAAKARFGLWAAHPEVEPPDAVPQIAAVLVRHTGDWRLMSTGIRWLVDHGACLEASTAHAALFETWGDSQAWQRLDQEVAEVCPVR